MTVVRTDIIPNLTANPIVSISKANPAVVTVPVIEQVVAASGTVSSIAGSGPWTATVTFLSTATTTGLKTGDIITATDGVGSIGTGEVSITAITGNQSITIKAVGGTTPVAGSVTDISLPAVGTLPASLATGDKIQIIGVENATLTFTQSASTGTFQVGQTVTQATSLASGVITGVVYNGAASKLNINTVTGTFDTTHLVSGPVLGLPLTPIAAPTLTPTAVVGMTELLTASADGNNTYTITLVDDNSFELDGVDSTAFTTANAGQFTTFDTVVITTP